MDYWKQISTWSTLYLCLWGSLIAFPNLSAAHSLPHYQIDVHYHPQQRKLQGKAIISFDAKAYPARELKLALPMNRFSEPDARGPRKILINQVFALDAFEKIIDDPLFPRGFDAGTTFIRSVTDAEGHPLSYTIQNNPEIVVGFSPNQGLLRVELPPSLKQSTIVVEFETKLPWRFEEGLVESELLTVQWHPLLLRFEKERWQADLMEPSPGTYAVRWISSQKGTLASTSGVFPVPANQTVVLPVIQRPLKYFPLVFSPRFQETGSSDSPIRALHLPGDSSRAPLLKQWGEEFLKFVQQRYHLPMPWEQLIILEMHGDYEQIRVINNLILVPTPHYKRTSILDRRVLGFFARGLGELWYGETLWHNEDTQWWLSRGLGAFLSLRFYAHKYGPDAGIFDFIDWLNPRYKEHFFESMVRQIKPELQQPIIAPIQRKHENAETRILLRMVTYKAALVVSMLEYLMGESAFQAGLADFYQQYQHQTVSEKEFQKIMEFHTNQDLSWFFEQWFHKTKGMDYALGEIMERPLAVGGYEIQVEVKKLQSAQMPVEVQLSTADNQVYRQRTSGRSSSEQIRFMVPSPLEKVSLDPDEHLLEESRINNHSFTFLRVRPAFDWKKQREVMSLLIPRISSNAIDGNQIGLESNNSFNRHYSLLATVGYGTKSQQPFYLIGFERKNLTPNLDVQLRFAREGGTQSQGIRFNFGSAQRREGLSYNFQAELEREIVFKTESDKDTTALESVEDEGETSNLALQYTSSFGYQNLYFPSWSLRWEQPFTPLGTDFHYTLININLSHLWNVGFQKRLRWTWIYNTTSGETPLQKKHQLGSPQVLRGFPQRTILRYDHIAASRLDYEFPLVATPWWGNVSSLGVQGSLFYDTGRGWNHQDRFRDTPLRKNIGIGLRWGVDAVALFEIPLKAEIAYPLDQEFDKPQFILGGAFSFF